MKNLLAILILTLSIMSFQSNAQNNKILKQREITTSANQNELKTVKFKITGITCAGCSNTIYLSLKKVDGIIEHSVKYPGNIAIIQFDDSKTSIETIKNIIEKKGYKAEVIKDKD